MKKRVACIGNMNNMFFSLVRYLRDKGVNADLLLRNNEFDHFSPEADSFTKDFLSYTYNLTWGHISSWYTTPKKAIKADLGKYDFIIGCGTVPAFLEKIDRRIDLFIPYGADLYGFPFMKFPRYIPLLYHFSKAQRKSIKKARNVCLDFANNLFEKPIQKITLSGKRHYLPIPMLYTHEYTEKNISQYCTNFSHTDLFQKIRTKHYPIVFHQTRQNWLTSPDLYTWKGNDKLIKGFASFQSQSAGNFNPALVLLEYGSDVQASKQLIKTLGIEKNTYWFPKMSRKELMVGLSLADIGSSEFTNSWLFCGTVVESLAMAKPLLHYRDDKLYSKIYDRLYPLMNANTEKEITDLLFDYTSRPEYYRQMGNDAKSWLDEYVINKPVNQIIAMINS